MKRNLRLVNCDFGYGSLRIDIEPVGLSIGNHVSKDGDFEQWSFSCAFDFRLIEWVRKAKAFLKMEVSA